MLHPHLRFGARDTDTFLCVYHKMPIAQTHMKWHSFLSFILTAK